MDRIIRGATCFFDDIQMWQRTDEITLPALTRDMMSLSAGGSFYGLDLPAEIKAMEAEISLNSMHEKIRSLFGREPGDWVKLIVYEDLLDVFPNNDANAPKRRGRVVIMKGLLNEVTQPGVKGVKASGPAKLKFSSIIHYKDVVNNKVIHGFDYKTNKLIMNGKNYTAEHNRLLRI